MNLAYDWAFSQPVRKVFYNIAVTGLSVAVALVIGTIGSSPWPRGATPASKNGGAGHSSRHSPMSLRRRSAPPP